MDEQIKSLDADVADLDEAVKAVEANPKKFGQFDTLEIQARKLFIEQSKKEVKNIKEGAFSKAATAKLQKKQREVTFIAHIYLYIRICCPQKRSNL